MRLRPGLATVMGLMLAAQVAGAQETRCERGDTEVREVRFSGNANFSDDDCFKKLSCGPDVLVTKADRCYTVCCHGFCCISELGP